MRLMLALAALLIAAPALAAPAAIATDPPRDAAHPARMEVLHVPVGGVEIVAVAYLASGAGQHPTLVLAHGWPGNEKNLDLAQAVRRAGWNAVTFNYRGSWGSPGQFHFAQNPDDAAAVLAYLRVPGNATKLGVDPRRIALGGHSMGGWVTARVAAKDPQLIGAALISMANMGSLGTMPRDKLLGFTSGETETLVTTPETMADELAANSAAFDVDASAPGLAKLPLLVVTSDDGLAGDAATLVAGVRKSGGSRITERHIATDHSYSDSRIALETAVLEWLETLR